MEMIFTDKICFLSNFDNANNKSFVQFGLNYGNLENLSLFYLVELMQR